MVRRVQTPGDRRSARVELTDRGREVEAAFRATVARRITAQVEPLPADDRRHFARLVSAVLAGPGNG
jgi:DNA-binding MarR family transcriptional regulator